MEKRKTNSPINEILENLDLVSSIDIIKWIPFKRITEVIRSVKEKQWKMREMMIREGDVGSDFYIVKSGTIEIYSDNPLNHFRKLIFRGDYFGESAIVGNLKRMANVRAVTDCSCLMINSNDFKWIFDTERQVQMINVSPLSMIENLQSLR